MPNPSLLVTPVNAIAGFPTIPAGANRTAVLEVNYFRTNSGNITVPTTVTVGGISGTYFAGDAPGSTQVRSGLTAWSFTESQIEAISGGAVIITGGTLGTQTRAVAYVVQDTKQGGVLNQATARVSTGGLSIPLTRSADSYTMFAGYVDFGESVTITNPAWVALIGNVNFAYAADTARTANTTTQSKTYVQTGHVVNFEPVPAQTITSVNGGAGVKIGSTGNTAVTNGFPSAPNAGTFGGKPITITAYDVDTKAVTFNGPVVVGGESFPTFSGTQTLVLTNGTESASLAGVPISPPTGSTLITVASPENIDTKAFGHILVAEGVTPENGDTFYGVDEDVTWLPTTFGIAVDLPVVTPVHFHKTSTGIAYELLLTVNGEGVEPPEEAEITSVGPVHIGGTTTVSVINFTGAVTAGTLDTVALSAASNTSITMAGLVDGVAVYRPGVRILSLTDGDQTASFTVGVLPPTGWGVYTLNADFVQAINGVATTYLPVGWALTDYVLYPMTPTAGKTTTVSDAGVVTNNVGVQELFLVDATTGLATAFSITTTSGVSNGGGTEVYHGRFLKGSYV